MTIEKKLKCGEAIVFQHNKSKKYRIVVGIKDGNEYRCSHHYDTIEECKQTIVGNYVSFKHLTENYTYISSFPFMYGDRPQIGDKVLILPNAKEECDKYNLNWDEDKENMIGKVCEIQICNGSDYLINGSYFPRTAFVLAIDEENSLDKIMAKLDDKDKEYLKNLIK